MVNLAAVLAQLKQERRKLDKAIAALSGRQMSKGKRMLSLAGRKRIAAAQRARWAKVRAKTAA